MNRRYNWKRSKPNEFDRSYHSRAKIENLPLLVDLRPLCPPVVDQGDLGSCTGNAIAGMWGFLELKELKSKIDGSEEFKKGQFLPASRLFIYYQERLTEGDVSEDNGAEIKDGIAAMALVGCCDETVWPYHVSKFNVKPPLAAFSEATNHKFSDYGKINTLDNMKRCLASGYPFVFGFNVYDNFESEETAKTGILTMPSGNVAGGHAVLCVGYDDQKKMVLVRNSWGTSWGLKGYFWMPYDYITDPQLADDMWTARK